MKHAALTVLTLWTATFTLINSGESNLGLFGAAVDEGQIGHLERRRRTLPGSHHPYKNFKIPHGRQHIHKNSKITQGSQTYPLEFSGLCQINKKHKNKPQHITKGSYANRNNATIDIVNSRFLGSLALKMIPKIIPLVSKMALKSVLPIRRNTEGEKSPITQGIGKQAVKSLKSLLEIWGPS